jgi:hypothetical protein
MAAHVNDRGRAMYKSGRRLALMGSCSALALLASTGTAWAAKTVFVSNAAPGAEVGGQCDHPSYTTIQGAVNAVSPGTAIKVCPGTYSEQLVIDKGVKISAVESTESVTVELPATIAAATGGPCSKSGEEETEVVVCTSEAVGLTKLVIDARFPAETCRGDRYGVYVGGGAKLTAKYDVILGAGASPANGCPGVGLQVGSTSTPGQGGRVSPEQVGRARLVTCEIEEYTADGIVAEGAGSKVTAVKSSIQGSGTYATVGVQIREGASGSVKYSTIRRNTDALRLPGAGVVLYHAAPTVVLYKNYIENYGRGLTFVSGATTPPNSPEVKIFRNHFIFNMAAGLVLEQGDALISYNIIEASEFGIEIVQSGSQPFASNSSAAHNTIQGTGEAAIKVASDLARNDPPGSFLIKSSFISNNPTEVDNESENFTVTRLNDK